MTTTSFGMPPPQILTISAGVHAVAIADPHRPALRVGDRLMTYGEIGTRIRKVAGAARSLLGRTLGERVVLLAPNCIEYPEIICGLGDLGLVVSTANPRCTAHELTILARDCEPRLLIVHPSLESVVRAAALPTVEKIVVLGEEYEAWIAAGEPCGIDPGLREEDGFALVYTSGTTGEPKGVVLSHRSRVLTFYGMAMEFGCFGPDDRHLAMAPMAHGAGFAFTMAPLFFGGYVEVLPKFDPEIVLSTLGRGRFTGTFMVPTHYQTIFGLGPATLDRYRNSTPALRSIISNASALPQSVKEKIVAYWGEGLLHETYGSTEGGVVTNLRPTDQLRKIQCVGKPFTCTQVRLLDDQGFEVAPGEVGELHSYSPFLFNGYFRQPDATRESMRDGWLSVGDLARRDEDGYLYIVDRKKDMVISGGLNIYPREIEEVLHGHASISEAAVVGVPDEQWGERLRAFVVARPGATLDSTQIEQHCRKVLAGYKVPREFRIVDALPRGASGKVLKNELRKLS
jgi:acyl-CoA synthetase (AMP-forming)/AMP-acid ligase II